MHKTIERFACIEKTTKDATSLIHEVIDCFFQAVKGRDSRVVLFEAKLLMRSGKEIKEHDFQHMFKEL